MEEGERVTLDLLYKEFARVQSKSMATDDWFFRFLSIAVVPFLVFIAYALGNPAYRIFIAALPFLSIIGVAVVMVLATHYIYVTTYGAYLERRINGYLRGPELRDTQFNKLAYRIWSSPVTLSYITGFFLLLAFNVGVVPVINLIFERFLATHPHLPPAYRIALACYWPAVLVSAIIFSAAALLCLFRTLTICRRFAPI